MSGVNAKKPDYSQTSFTFSVGGGGWGTDKSIGSFSEGKFRIVTDPEWVERLRKKGRIDADAELDESGITPSQVISFDYHIQTPNIIYSLLYRDSEGMIQLATWNFIWAEDKVKAFKKAFLNWMSTDPADQRRK
ncbi:hypothetical protein SynA15127_01468 [Synechococcus sp. A15-127]|nr:hypothetical protein SynA15127_01468 [Synechococcus sp. A15-127]